MVAITAAQLQAIRATVSGQGTSQHALEERKALHTRSKQMTSAWPDALHARRQRKQKERTDKLAREEAVRAELDRQDAAEREELRQKRLQEAAQKLWEQTDEMKTLHRSRLLADTVRERQRQLTERAQHAAAVRDAEVAHLRQQQRLVQEALMEDERKAQAAKEKAASLSKAREEQLDALKTRLLAEREDGRRNGREIRALAQQEAEKEAQKEEAGRQSARAAVKETEEANQALLELKRQQKEQERQADAQIAAYAAKKAALEEERAATLAAKAAAKEAHRRGMAQMMEQNLLGKQRETDARQTAAAEEDSAYADAAKSRVERAAEIERSRREQVTVKHLQAQQRSREQAALSVHISSAMQAFKIEQEQAAARQKDKNIAHAAFLLHQIEAKHQRSLDQAMEMAVPGLNSVSAHLPRPAIQAASSS